MLKKMKNNKKGFTLVELIVVLVILAILAALLIPALTGYIDKAKNKSIVAETRQVVMAAQTLVDEKYGTVDVGANVKVEGVSGVTGNYDVTKKDITDLAEVKGTIVSISLTTDKKIDTLVYTNGAKRCTYKATLTATDKFTDGNYNVDKAPASTGTSGN